MKARNPARGERHGRAKLTLWDVLAIRAVLQGREPPSIRSLSRAFGVTRDTICAIRDGRTWRI